MMATLSGKPSNTRPVRYSARLRSTFSACNAALILSSSLDRVWRSSRACVSDSAALLCAAVSDATKRPDSANNTRRGHCVSCNPGEWIGDRKIVIEGHHRDTDREQTGLESAKPGAEHDRAEKQRYMGGGLEDGIHPQ